MQNETKPNEMNMKRDRQEKKEATMNKTLKIC